MLILNRRKLLQWSIAAASAREVLKPDHAEAFRYGLSGGGAQPPGGYRVLDKQPYSRLAYINSPIGSGAVWDTTSTAAQQLRNIGVTTNTIATVHCSADSQPWFSGNIGDNLVTVVDSATDTARNCGTGQVYIKTGATPSVNTQHMSVVDYVNGWVWHGYQCTVSDSSGANFSPTRSVTPGCSIHFNQGRYSNLYGNALDPFFNTAQRNRLGWGDGAVRSWEATRGRIDHVLRCVMSYNLLAAVSGLDPNKQQFPTYQTDYCAFYTTGACSGTVQTYTGLVPFGVLLGIPASVDITQMKVSGVAPNANQKMLFTAAQNYGLLCRDSTGYSSGNAQFAVNCEPSMASANSQLITDWIAAMPTLVANLGICMNYAENQWPYAGCGTPRAVCPPYSAFDV